MTQRQSAGCSRLSKSPATKGPGCPSSTLAPHSPASGKARASPARPASCCAPIYDWFTEGLDTGPLIEARTLLDELEKR